MTGFDINPMAWWIVRQEIGRLDLSVYREAAARIGEALERSVGDFYRTRCECCGRPEVPVKYFLWVKTRRCVSCQQRLDLFPGYLLAEQGRHPRNVLVCSCCGGLVEVDSIQNPGSCPHCSAPLVMKGPALRNRCACPRCGVSNRYPDAACGPPEHRMFAIEYHCPSCRPGHAGRFFKKPDGDDQRRFEEAARVEAEGTSRFVPLDEIPSGDETARLHRWGYRRYRELFNPRQLLGLNTLCREVLAVSNPAVCDALATNVSDLLRYQNMLCRFDTMALKSLEIFSVHGFPVGLVQCESNLLGIRNVGHGTSVGSGGWTNIVDKYLRAKAYCERPFEVQVTGRRKAVVFMEGEWIGDRSDGFPGQVRGVELHCASSTDASLPEASLDAVFTDPPYFANVQYAELMDFCHVWLRRLVGERYPEFGVPTTRNPDEFTGNVTLSRGLEHFTHGLSRVFQSMTRALKPGGPMAFTYHHNALEAYFTIASAILDSRTPDVVIKSARFFSTIESDICQ